MMQEFKNMGSIHNVGTIDGDLNTTTYINCYIRNEISPPPLHTTPVFEKQIKFPIKYGLKPVILNFVGRKNELKELWNILNEMKCHGVVLTGQGGIGKTELAKQFVYNVTKAGCKESSVVVTWLAADTPESLKVSLAKFSRYLKLKITNNDGKPLDVFEIVENIWEYISSSIEDVRWLIAFDNVDTLYEEFKSAAKALNLLGQDAFMLVTSRRRDIFPSVLRLLPIAPLELEDSILFVNTALNLDDSHNKIIKELCDHLQNLPLALQQSMAYIKQQRVITLKGMSYGIPDYMEELKHNEGIGLENPLELHDYPLTVLNTGEMTINNIRNNYGVHGISALNILEMLSFMNPDHIQVKFIYKLYPKFFIANECDIEKGVQLLSIFSLINVCNEIANIHRLVQMAVILKIFKSLKFDQLSRYWSGFEETIYNRCEIRHVMSIWKHTVKTDLLVNQFVDICNRIYQRLSSLSMVHEQYVFALCNYKLLCNTLGEEHTESLTMEGNLAHAMFEKGDYKECLLRYKLVHEKTIKILREEHTISLGIAKRMVVAFLRVKNYEEALKYCQRVLELKMKALSEDNEETVNVKHNVALTLEKLGRREEAMTIYEEVLNWQIANNGDYHIITLSHTYTTKQNIASCLYRLGKLEEAKTMFVDVLKYRERTLGNDHLRTLVTKSWLADTYENLGEMEVALEMNNEVLKIENDMLGPDHPNSKITQNSIERLKGGNVEDYPYKKKYDYF